MAYELFYVVIQNKRRRFLSIFESSFSSQNIITLPASSVRSIYTFICFKQIIKQILTFRHTRITNVLNKRCLPSAQLRPRKLKTIQSFWNVLHVSLGPNQSFKTRFLDSTAVTNIKIKVKRKPTENGEEKLDQSAPEKTIIIRASYLNPRGVSVGVLARGVPPGSLNPDPIWDQKM